MFSQLAASLSSFLYIVRNYIILHLEDFLLSLPQKRERNTAHGFTPKIIHLREVDIVH